ncbi:MAG: mechanosensitive ion channel domain-containing protein [Sneathiella sp.]
MFKFSLAWLLAVFLLFSYQNISVAQVPGVAVPAETSEQTSITDIQSLSQNEIRDLLSRLSDREVREILIKQLDTALETAPEVERPGGPFHEFILDTASGIGTSMIEAVFNIPKILGGLADGFSNFGSKHGAQGVFTFIGILVLGLAVGVFAEVCVNQFAKKWRDQIQKVTEDATFIKAVKRLSQRLAIQLLGIAAFFAVSATITQIFMPDELLPATDFLVTNLIVLPRLIAAMGRFLLAPNRPDLRLVYTDDYTAKFMYRHQTALVFFLGFTYWILIFLNKNGVPIGETDMGFWLITIFYLWLAYALYHVRHGITMMMIGKPDGHVSKVQNFISRVYPWFAITMTLFTWILVQSLAFNQAWHFLSGQAETTLFILLFTPVVDTLIRGLVGYKVKPMKGEGVVAEEAYQAAKNCYFRIGRVISFGLAIIIIASIWEIDFSRLAAAGVGVQLAGKLFQFLLIVAFGYLIWELVSLWINRKLAAEMTAAAPDLNNEEPGGGEGGGTGASRLSTVLPLIRFTVQSAIIVITFLIALGEIGIEITPLLAGAGIIGLAVGFGAQKLVADIVSGIFFLVDDAFRAGEYLEIEGTFGTVEKISLRSLQLRHHKGPVHTIPYGEIPKITNYSRDWVIVKLRFTVPFDTDLNKVKKLFKKIGAEMMEFPEFANDLMQPFKSQGVLEVNDIGIVVRGKFMAKPGTQFVLRKEIYARVQKAFDENGLQFARKEVRVKIDGDTNQLTEEEKQRVSAAASEAAEPVQPQ